MSASQPGGIRSLCVAMAHRWEPGRIFVILTAFLDESGTHGGDGTPQNPASPTTVMAGMMGSAQQWARFAANADALRRNYGFRIFHMKDFIRRRGEFSGWAPEKQMAFLRDFGAIIDARHLMEGVTYRVDNADFAADFIGERPKGIQLDTAYAFCFRNCVYHLSLEAERRFGHHRKWNETKLHFVLELGHKNSGDAVRIFNEIKADFQSQGLNHLGAISLMTKEESIELTIGDFLAYTAWSMDQARRAGRYTEEQLFGGPIRGNSNIMHITNRPGGLANMRQQFLDQVRQRKGQKPTALASSSDATARKA